MARNSLNKKNLLRLGADTLADLLLEAVKGDATRQRRVRLALSGDQGPQDAAADIRKRFASIRRARSFISRKGQRTLATELTGMIALIETRIAPQAPGTGFDLVWALLQLAPDIHSRTDDSLGTIGDVMDAAMSALERLSLGLAHDPSALADQVFDAVVGDGYGAFDGVIPALADALGPPGLERLKDLAKAMQDAPLTDTDLAGFGFVDDPSRRADLARDSRNRTAAMILQDIADLQGDVDAWLARYTAEQLTYHTIAPDAAARLLAAGRPQDALRLVETAQARGGEATPDRPELDDAHFACLEALGHEEDLRQALWARFERHLCGAALRRYLARLPDFEDIDAEDRAKAIALAHHDPLSALAFLVVWPDLPRAAQLVEARADTLDGDAYELLSPAADALEADHPLASVVLRRAMILFTLTAARSSRYGHAARHLAACAAADMDIAEYRDFPDHHTFLETLKRDHARKAKFWNRVHSAAQ